MKFSGIFILTFLILIFVLYIKDIIHLKNRDKQKHGPKKNKKINQSQTQRIIPSKPTNHNKESADHETDVNTQIRPWEKCKSPERYVFLKKHKVASSTLKTIFGNFERHMGIQGEPQLIGNN